MVYSKDDPGDLADESAIVLLLDIGDQQVEGAGTLNRELVALSLGVSVDDDDSHDQEHDKKIPLPSVYENCFIHVNVVFPFHGWFACSSRLLRGSQFSDTVPLGGEPITYLSPLFFSAFDILRTRTS